MRVVVAMSGGVDSSVVAGLLSEQGHEVIGVTLQLYDHGAAAKRRGACCAGEDIHDAKRVADRLGIAHYVIDAEARFRAAVMEDFAAGYAAGETPVPCVRCNQSLKFGDLIDMARDLGAEAMATGHYVRRVEGVGRSRNCTRPWIRGAGPELVPLRHDPRDQLAYSRFPLGDMPGQSRGAGRGRATGPRRRGEAGQPGHLLRARRPLHRHRAEAPPGRDGAGRDRRWRGPACWAIMRASRATRWARPSGSVCHG